MKTKETKKNVTAVVSAATTPKKTQGKKPSTKKSNNDNFSFDAASLPNCFNFEYWKGISERIVYVDADIDMENASFLPIKQIIRWNIEDVNTPVKSRKPIYIFFHSYGGDADICTAMIDAIRASKTPIIGVNLGCAFSAAAYMFIACHKRYMMPRASILFHQGSAEFGGTYAVIIAGMREYEKKVDRLAGIVKEFTNIPEDEVEENIVNEWYINAEEALEKGVCDKVVKSIDEIFKK